MATVDTPMQIGVLKCEDIVAKLGGRRATARPLNATVLNGNWEKTA